jgi:ubiquinone/menaquinone biosynthesis C-methylase UbiE/chorismate mutase
MNNNLTLEQLGRSLLQVDTQIMNLAHRRMELAHQVGHVKRRDNQPIYRAEIEEDRLKFARELARKLGLNPHFASALLYLLIDEACKLQMIQLQEEVVSGVAPLTTDQQYEQFKENLRNLTARWAPKYDAEYEKTFFATHACLTLEMELMREEVKNLPDNKLLIDLGCATGRLTFPLAESFRRAIGFDISHDMLSVARKKIPQPQSGDKFLFLKEDLDEGIPRADNTASYVVMNLGTASEVRNIGDIVKETLRVLKPGGRYFFSFYNRDALLYKWELLPWPVGLAARIDMIQDCLNVRLGSSTFQVYARAYTVDEVRDVLSAAGTKPTVVTFPTVSSILPGDLFEGQRAIEEAVLKMDRDLMHSGMGAYIVATGQKE